MSHTYASVEDFRRYIIDGGDSAWTQADDTILSFLEGASRRVDGYCDRSRFGSGFGPRTGTNKYDYPDQYASELCLYDDLLAITSVTTHATYGDSGTTITDGTHFIKRPSTGAPYRELELLYSGGGAWGAAQEGNVIVGTWGYSNETYSLGTGGTVSSSATSIVVSGGTAYAGQTLLIESEQVYVTATGGTATIVRGVNGTTAAVHAAGVALSAYRYPREVVTATLQVAARRFRSSQAGLIGDFGGGGLPVTVQRDSELSILRAAVGHLRILSAG